MKKLGKTEEKSLNDINKKKKKKRGN